MNTVFDIEQKQDSPEKLSVIAGKPTKNFLFAEEVNKITDSIKQDQLLRLPNRVARFSATNTLEASSLLFDDGTRIGVGAASTGGRFEVRAQGSLSTDIAFRVRNSANSRDSLIANGAGDVYNNGAAGFQTNTFFGENVGRSVTGNHNTCFGYLALRVNNSSLGTNTAFGSNALSNNGSGDNNTCIGAFSLEASISGSRNVAIGSSAGRSIASFHTSNFDVNQSIFIGCESRALASGQTNQIVIGFSATGDGSNSVVIGNSSITRTRLQGQVLVGQFSTAPTGINGAIYYNTVERKHYGFDGATWNAFY